MPQHLPQCSAHKQKGPYPRGCQHTPAGSGVGNRRGPGTAGLAMQKKQQGRLGVRSAWGHRSKPHKHHAGNPNGAGGTGDVVLFPGPVCRQGAQSKILFCKLRSRLPEQRPQPCVLTVGFPGSRVARGAYSKLLHALFLTLGNHRSCTLLPGLRFKPLPLSSSRCRGTPVQTKPGHTCPDHRRNKSGVLESSKSRGGVGGA